MCVFLASILAYEVDIKVWTSADNEYAGTEECIYVEFRGPLVNVTEILGCSFEVGASNEAAFWISGDIETMRAAFKPLSESMIGGEIPEGYVKAFCPMADGDRGASWVQKDGASLMNPYFGASMLHCGIFKD